MEFHKIKDAKDPKGHYTPAVSYNGVLYISGQVPTDPITGEKFGDTLEEQFKGILNNIDNLLKDNNTSRDNVLKVSIYVSDSKYWGEINEIYKDFFKNHKPARIIVPAGEFRNGYLVEVEAIAKI